MNLEFRRSQFLSNELFFCWIHFNIQEYAIMFRGKGIEKEIHNIPWTFGKPLALSHLNITRDNSPTGKCFQFRDKWCRHKDVQWLPQDHPNRKSRQWDLHLCCLGSYYSSASALAFCSALGPWEWDSELKVLLYSLVSWQQRAFSGRTGDLLLTSPLQRFLMLGGAADCKYLC